MATEQKNIVVCPSCGAENIEGVDTCENCMADLRTIDVPESTQIASESDLTLPIGSLRISKARAIPPETPIRDAITHMGEEAAGAVVVMAAGRIVGIFTERDVLKKIAPRPELLGQPVSEYMTPDPVVLRDDDMMAYALNKMGDGGFRHIPVVRDGQFIGMVTGRDIMNWVLGRFFD